MDNPKSCSADAKCVVGFTHDGECGNPENSHLRHRQAYAQVVILYFLNRWCTKRMCQYFTTWNAVLTSVVLAVPPCRRWLAAPSRVLGATVGALSVCLFAATPKFTSWKRYRVHPVMFVGLELVIHHGPWLATCVCLRHVLKHRREREENWAALLAFPAAVAYHAAVKEPPYKQLLPRVPNAAIGYATIGVFTAADMLKTLCPV